MTVAIIFAGLIVLAALNELYTLGSVCLRCGGRNAHRSDCPLNND